MNSRGQSLAEFALIALPLMALLLGMVQFGMLFFSQHVLTQVGRDVGRWAATQQFSPCDSTDAKSAIATQADLFAQQSGLLGYSAGTFASSGVGASWETDSGFCPPESPSDVSWVKISIAYDAPSLIPWLETVTISTSATFRMEPRPQT